MFPYWPRTVENRAALRTAVAALSAVLVAFTFHLPSPYWSGMSVVIISNLYTGSIIDKAMMRITGTIIGAVVGFFLAGMVANSFLLYLLCCFLIIAISVYHFYYSRYGYAYLLGALCAFIVISQVVINPQNAFNVAIWRPVEIALGVVVFALCVYAVFPNHLKDNIIHQVSELFDSYINEFKKLALCIEKNELAVEELDASNLLIKKKLRKAIELIVSLNAELGVNQAQVDRLRAFLDSFFALARQMHYVIALPHTAADLQILHLALVEKMLVAITNDLEQIKTAFISGQSTLLHLQSKLVLDEFEANIEHSVKTDFIYSFAVFLNQVSQRLSFLHSLLAQAPIVQEKQYKLITRRDRLKKNKELIQHAIKAGFAVLLAVGFWLLSNWPGGINGIVSSLIISIRLNLLEMKNTMIHRLLGCTLGGGLALASLAAVEMNLYDFTVLLFFGVWGFSYFMFKFPKYAYIGLQANIALILTLAQEGGPPTLLDPPLQRLAGIVIGIAASFIVANILWRTDVWTLLQRYLEKIYNYMTFNLRQVLLVKEQQTIHELASIFWLARSLLEALGALRLKPKKRAKLASLGQRFESLIMTQATISYILTSIDRERAHSTAALLNLNSAVESTSKRYCTESSRDFCHFLPHRMGDTISEKNDKNLSNLQNISASRYDSTAEFRLNVDLLVYEDELVAIYEQRASADSLYERLKLCMVGMQDNSSSATIAFSDLKNLLAYLNALKQLCLSVGKASHTVMVTK